MQRADELYATDAEAFDPLPVVTGPGINFLPAWGVAAALAPQTGAARGCTISGTARNDVLVGTSGDDVICAGGGDD